jgi:hypothetical protein
MIHARKVVTVTADDRSFRISVDSHLQDYLARRCRKPKPSERVRVAVKVSYSSGVGYGPEPDQAEVW